jgi:FAD:protein FMN transferase
MHTHTFPALGSQFAITVWDTISEEHFSAYMREIETYVHTFEQTYSRFIPTSLLSHLAGKTGTFEVPSELTTMLRYYEQVSLPTQGKITPAIGATLSDLGYDASYSFVKKDTVRTAPAFEDALTIVDPTHLTILQPIHFDLGALGKGYVVDRIVAILRAHQLTHLLVNGSGDIRYLSPSGIPITCGLEHPTDPTLAIGTLTLTEGSLCASGTRRRRWGTDTHHYVDPHTGTSPNTVLATWVWAPTAALADLLASTLFFVAPEALTQFSFEYLIVNQHLQQKRSAGFTAELFSDSTK